MKIFLYCLKEYFKYVIGTLVLTIFLFVLFDFIHKSTKYFPEYKPSYNDILLYYLFQIPSQLVQALPIGSLLGGVVSMILLNRTNEITAMRAIGLGPLQLAKPLFFGGALVSFCSFVLNESIVPRYTKKVNYIQSVKIEQKSENSALGAGRWIRDGNIFVHWREYDFISQELIKVQIVVLGPSFTPTLVYESERAQFDSSRKEWRMSNVRADYIKATKTLAKSEVLESFVLKLPIEPGKLSGDSRKPSELSRVELNDAIIRGERSGSNVIPFKMDYEGKIAYPFAALVVSLIGLKFAYKSERSADTAKGVLLAFFIGISYWVVLSAARALGLRGDLNPTVAAWLPNVIVTLIVGLDGWLANAKRLQ